MTDASLPDRSPAPELRRPRPFGGDVVLVSFAAAVLLLVLAIVDVATIGTAALVLAVALLIIVTGAIARSVSRMITDDDGE